MARPQRIAPDPGQESVWDYPRPPRLEPTSARLEVVLGGQKIAETVAGYRVLETSHPPTYYLPRVVHRRLSAAGRRFDRVRVEGTGCMPTSSVARSSRPAPRGGTRIPPRGSGRSRDHLAVMPGLVDACFVDGELVVPQPGGFYGGWITSSVVGPFKGGPGTHGW